jgi:hypothetical protein
MIALIVHSITLRHAGLKQYTYERVLYSNLRRTDKRIGIETYIHDSNYYGSVFAIIGM